MDLLAVYITFPSLEEAKTVCKKLLTDKSIACANISQVNALYTWKGNVEDESEYAALCKTTHSKLESIKSTVNKVHSYDVPCITSWTIEANSEYSNWIKSCLDKP